MKIRWFPDWVDNDGRIVWSSEFVREIHKRLGVPVRDSRALASLVFSLIARLVSENRIVYFPHFGFLGLWTDRNVKGKNYALRYPRFTTTKQYLDAIHQEDRSGKTPDTRIISASELPLNQRPGRLGKRKLSTSKVEARQKNGSSPIVRNNRKSGE